MRLWTVALLILFILATVPAAAAGRVHADGLLGLTAAELQGLWGASAEQRPPTRPYQAEYRFTRGGQVVEYRLAFDVTGRLAGYAVDFDAPVPLAEVPLLVPEAAFLSSPQARFTFQKLPLRDYAQDAVVYAYLPAPDSWRDQPCLAVLLLPEGFGYEASQVGPDLLIRGLWVSIHQPEAGETEITPFR